MFEHHDIERSNLVYHHHLCRLWVPVDLVGPAGRVGLAEKYEINQNDKITLR